MLLSLDRYPFLFTLMSTFQEWDEELARVAQKWADQCANVDYRGDVKRKDPFLFHDEHSDRKIGKYLT